jgi:hypothetical protein
VVFLIVFENEEPNIKNGLMLSISYACTWYLGNHNNTVII